LKWKFHAKFHVDQLILLPLTGEKQPKYCMTLTNIPTLFANHGQIWHAKVEYGVLNHTNFHLDQCTLLPPQGKKM